MSSCSGRGGAHGQEGREQRQGGADLPCAPVDVSAPTEAAAGEREAGAHGRSERPGHRRWSEWECGVPGVRHGEIQRLVEKTVPSASLGILSIKHSSPQESDCSAETFTSEQYFDTKSQTRRVFRVGQKVPAFCLKKPKPPRPVRLCGSGGTPCAERRPVRSPVRAHAWVVGAIFLSRPLPRSLKTNKTNKNRARAVFWPPCDT